MNGDLTSALGQMQPPFHLVNGVKGSIEEAGLIQSQRLNESNGGRDENGEFLVLTSSDELTIHRNRAVTQSTPFADLRSDDHLDRQVTPEILTGSVVVHEEHYYVLKPLKNKIFNLLDDLKHYRVTLKNLGTELQRQQVAKDLPLQMKQVRIIIEYFDCIIDAKGLQEYQELPDDSQHADPKTKFSQSQVNLS